MTQRNFVSRYLEIWWPAIQSSESQLLTQGDRLPEIGRNGVCCQILVAGWTLLILAEGHCADVFAERAWRREVTWYPITLHLTFRGLSWSEATDFWFHHLQLVLERERWVCICMFPPSHILSLTDNKRVFSFFFLWRQHLKSSVWLKNPDCRCCLENLKSCPKMSPCGQRGAASLGRGVGSPLPLSSYSALVRSFLGPACLLGAFRFWFLIRAFLGLESGNAV